MLVRLQKEIENIFTYLRLRLGNDPTLRKLCQDLADINS